MLRCFRARLSPVALDMTLSPITRRAVVLSADDLYKICGLFSGADDPLELRQHKSFLQALLAAKDALEPNTITPFQATVIKAAFDQVDTELLLQAKDESLKPESRHEHKQVVESAGASTSKVMASATKGQVASDDEPTIDERLTAIWNVASSQHNQQHQVSSVDSKNVHRHCAALTPLLRKLTPTQTTSIAHALSLINFQDYAFVSLLARRGCEVAGQVTAKELCRLYYNLSRLNVHDSMVAMVNHIEANLDSLTWKDFFLLLQALERQPLTSAAMAKVLPKLATRIIGFFGKDSHIHAATFHRALLNSLAKYNLNKHPACIAAVRDVLRFADTIGEKDLFAILSAIVDLKVGQATGSSVHAIAPPSLSSASSEQPITISTAITELVSIATRQVPKMDCRQIPVLMDLASMLPSDTSALMSQIMERLSNEGGKLSPHEVVTVVDMLATYPPARGHVCIAQLAFAVSVRKEAYDGDAAELLLLSFAKLGHFTDDYFAIADFAFTSRQGLKSYASLRTFLGCLDKNIMIHHKMKAIVTAAVQLVVPALNDEELSQVRKELFRLGAEDRSLQQRILNRQQSLKSERRGGGSGFGSKRYDPVDDLLSSQ